MHVSYVVRRESEIVRSTIIKIRRPNTRSSARVPLSDRVVTLPTSMRVAAKCVDGRLRWERETENRRRKEAAQLALDIGARGRNWRRCESEARLEMLESERDVPAPSSPLSPRKQKEMERAWTDDQAGCCFNCAADDESAGSDPH